MVKRIAALFLLLALSAKTKLRLLPPLNIPMELLAEAVDVIMEALK